MILIHPNVSNRIMLIHSSVNKFFKKQNTNMLHCFVNRRSSDESSDSMDKKSFLKKIEVTNICVFKKAVENYTSTRCLSP